MSEKLDPEDMREVLRVFHERLRRRRRDRRWPHRPLHGRRHSGLFRLSASTRGRRRTCSARRPRHRRGPASRERRTGAGFGVRLQVRIGIHTGPGCRGRHGRRARRATAAQSSARRPMSPARLQGEAEPDTVVVSAATRRLIEGQFSFEDLGARALKGVSALIRVFRVVGTGRDAGSLRRARRPRPDATGRPCRRAGDAAAALGAGARRRNALRAAGRRSRHRQVARRARLSRSAGRSSRIRCASWYCSSYHSTSAFFPVIAWLHRSLGLDAQDDSRGGHRQARSTPARSLDIDDPNAVSALSSMLRLTPDETVAPRIRRWPSGADCSMRCPR